MTLGIDYAWHVPDPAKVRADGYSFVLRYLSTDPTKNLSVTEASNLHAHGLGIGLIWETTATRASAGYSAGVADRQAAERQAAALRYPIDAVLFYAVDQDVDPAHILPYAKGWHAAEFNHPEAKRPTGPYGDKKVIEAVHAAGLSTVEWQTEAWSGTAVSGQADIYQRVHVTRPAIAGGGYDEDVLLHPVKLWEPPAPKPVAKPAPKPPAKPVAKPAAKPAPNALPTDPAKRQALFIRLLLALLRKFGFKF